MKMLGSHQAYWEVDADGKVVNSLSLPIGVCYPLDGTGASEAAGVLRNSFLLNFCKIPAKEGSELGTFLKNEGHDASSIYSLATQAFNLDSAGPAQAAAAILMDAVVKRGTYTKEEVLRILCVMHKNDNARSKSVQTGYQAYIEALQRSGRLKAEDVIDTDNEDIGELKKLDDLGNLRSCIHAVFFNKQKHYGNAGDFDTFFKDAAATVPQALADNGVTALDSKAVELMAKLNALNGRSTGRFMMTVSIDGGIALTYAYMQLYSQSEAWRKKSERALNAAHKVAVKAFESSLYRPIFRASAMAGEVSSQINYMILFSKTVADLGIFFRRLHSSLTKLLSPESIPTLQKHVSEGKGVCAALEAISGSGNKLFNCWDDETFVKDNTGSEVAQYRTKQVNEGDKCTGNASATNEQVVEPLIYFLVALKNELDHFFRDYVVGGALHPDKLSASQQQLAAVVPPHSIQQESNFALLSAVVDQNGGQKGEVPVATMVAKLHHNRKRGFGAGEKAQSAQTLVEYQRTLTNEQLDEEHAHYKSKVEPFQRMIASDKAAQGQKKRADKAEGADDGKKKLKVQEAEAKAALGRLDGLTVEKFDARYDATSGLPARKMVVEQARKDIKIVYGTYKVTGFDKVHKKLSEVIDQEALKIPGMENAKVKMLSQKMGTKTRSVSHQWRNVRWLITWVE